MSQVLSTTDLLRATGYKRQSDLERCLREQGVHVFYGKDGVWTTIDLINAAGGLRRGAANDPYPANILGDSR